MDFNVTKHEKFVDKVLNSTFQPLKIKLPLVKFWYHTKKEYPQLPEKHQNTPLSQLHIYVKPEFLQIFQIKHFKILNIEAVIRSRLPY